jgi:hypothetical protein
MNKRRKIEIYSADSPTCHAMIDQVKKAACKSCDIVIRDMMLPEVQRSATDLGILSLPAVVVDGRLARCRTGRIVEIDVLRDAGLGQPIE